MDWMPNTLTNLASYASILGLLLSFGTLVYAYFIDQKVSEIKKSYLFKKRYRSHITGLNSILTRINSELVFPNPNYQTIKNAFVEAIPELNSLSRKINNKTVVKLVSKTTSRIEIFRRARKINFSPNKNWLIESIARSGWGSSISIDNIHFFRTELNLVRDEITQLYSDLQRSQE